MNTITSPFRIDKQKLDQLAKRDSKKVTVFIGILGVLFTLINIIALIFTEPSFEINFNTITYLSLNVLLVLAIIVGIMFISNKWFFYVKKNFWMNKEFQFTDTEISVQTDYDRLNFFNKWGAKKMQRQYGIDLKQTILFSDLRKTKIKKNEIKFYDLDNILNTIILPKECENFSEIKAIIEESASVFKLK